MIEATFHRRGGSLVGFDLSGHAGLAESGHDIVCAAVSALSQSVLIGLEEVIGVDILAEIDEEDGRLHCRLPDDLTPQQRREAEVLLETFFRSLRSIEAGYGDAIEIREIVRT